MPYLHLDLAQTYPSETKRKLATRLCHLYADVMRTQLWRPNVGIAELGEDNLFHLGKDVVMQPLLGRFEPRLVANAVSTPLALNVLLFVSA